MLAHTEPVTVHIVHLSFRYHNAKIPLTPPCNPCKVRNPGCQLSLFPGLLRLQDSGSIFSSPICFSKIQTSGLHTNSAGHSPSWIWISSLFRFRKSTAYTTKHSDKSSKLRAHIFTESYFLQIPLARMNTYSPSHIPFFPLVSLHLSVFPIQESNALVIFLDILHPQSQL